MATLTGDWQKDRVKVTFGLIPKKKDHYGIMMYHKNRLIKAYEKVGCQLKVEETDGSVSLHANYNQCPPSSQMSHVSMSYRPRARGEVSGSSESLSVTSSNLLTTSKTSSTPKSTGTTRQQIWERIRGMGKAKKKKKILFLPSRLTLSALGIKLNEYWREVTERQAKERAFNAVDKHQGEEETFNDKWVSVLFSESGGAIIVDQVWVVLKVLTTPLKLKLKEFSVTCNYEKILYGYVDNHLLKSASPLFYKAWNQRINNNINISCVSCTELGCRDNLFECGLDKPMFLHTFVCTDSAPTWIQCEECLKWRSVPLDYYDNVPDTWHCSQNPNPRYRCVSHKAHSCIKLTVFSGL